MRLSRITIKNFRRIEYADITIAPTTFIIGHNNIGKTTIIKAIDALLSLSETVKPQDFRILKDKSIADTIEICGFFSDIDDATANSRGFKGRVVGGQYIYKKTYNLSSPSKPKITTFQYDYEITDQFQGITTWEDLMSCTGLSEEELTSILSEKRPKKDTLPKEWELKIDGAVEWKLDSEPKEVENPGGIPSVVLSKLPRLVHIPSYTDVNDIGKADGNKTLLGECLGILFEDLMSQNEIAAGIQAQLELLQTQMSPETDGSIIDRLCKEVNQVISDVFPDCGIAINPSLNNLSSVLKPQYSVELYSNVHTDAERQGTGLVRTGIFSMLRYHSHIKLKEGATSRPLLVAFEEPEIYLHPSAANLLRDTIYALGQSDQIICTTHSPWMIDLSKDWQSLTKLYINQNDYTSALNYGLSDATSTLQENEKEQIKMIKTFDDELSRIFFAEKCVVVEGDSELIAIKNSLKHLPPSIRKEILSKVQVVKARGKGAIIPIIKYLKALSIPFHVIHDRDKGKEGAEKFNNPILEAAGAPQRVSVLDNCLEDCLGYSVPSSDKPYHTHLETSKWTSWDDIPETWKEVMQKAFEFSL
ncbi:ATP-dependent nuclease [Effusibacillus lacus]|uniref:Uncharacterized protein n=1 Tax=Effusibacillus lacus TaxID=1348429 RepID=A0A292YRG9_9BACL|nr:ATP-dependent endonuclease [Effusibacillus lacus]TCS75742.1 putative ATP-dependent endonuclease of OLD family [Effusibacillus lacus]GAX91060.1 hypothetical protein EFBL_2720 [Effusibacillus lacus]